MFPSKEAVAVAAETELWDAYLERFTAHAIDGTVLDTLRDARVATIGDMGEDWTRRVPRHPWPGRPHPRPT